MASNRMKMFIRLTYLLQGNAPTSRIADHALPRARCMLGNRRRGVESNKRFFFIRSRRLHARTFSPQFYCPPRGGVVRRVAAALAGWIAAGDPRPAAAL